MSLRFTSIAFAAALMLSAGAQAATNDQNSIKVSLADLDLHSAAGHAAMVTRIDQAVTQVCAPAPQTLLQLQQVRACRVAALDQLTPAVTAIFAAATAKADKMTVTASN
jgi:UrcA family protein